MLSRMHKSLQWMPLMLLLLAWQPSATVSTAASGNKAPPHKNAQQLTAAQPPAAELQQNIQQQQQQQQQFPSPSLTSHTAHAHQHTPPQQQHSEPLMTNAQYTHDMKDTGYAPPDLIKDITGNDDEYNDPYQYLNELKPEPLLPWNPYAPPPTQTINPYAPTAFPHTAYSYEAPTPRFFPMFGFPQPVFVPFPMYIAPELFYPAYTGTATHSIDAGESMARAAGERRPLPGAASLPPTGAAHTSNAYAARNSPIYYVRLPPMPYMLLPSMGYTPAPTPQPTGAYGAALSSLQPYAAVSPFPALSPIFNLPMSFVANGKPGSIYQMSNSPPPTSDMQGGQVQFGNLNGFGVRAPPPPPPPTPLTLPASHHGGYRPAQHMTSGASNYLSHPPFGISPAQPAAMQHDSKLTLLKRPYMFNGRPDDIYILPNNFNPIYSNRGFY